MGVEIRVEILTKSFGKQLIWGDVSLTLPPGEICVMLGPSGTGKSVFLKTIMGLLKPDSGHVRIEGTDIATCSERDLYEVRKLFGVLFQDGAMFGSMNLYDNVAFPLREHTRKSESEIRSIVMDKMDMVGLVGDEMKLPGAISGGMRKRAGLARARRTRTTWPTRGTRPRAPRRTPRVPSSASSATTSRAAPRRPGRS